MSYLLVITFAGITVIIAYLIAKLAQRSYQTLPAECTSSINPSNTVLVFDIHGVLFKHNYKRMLRLLLSAPHPLRLCAQLCNPSALYDFFTLVLAGAVPEKCMVALTKKYPGLRPYIPLSIIIANSQIPNTATIELVRELKRRGYTLHILSNIGEIFFADLQQKFPELFAHFDVIHVACAADDYVAKPNEKFFRDYIKRYGQSGKNIIFIDDKIKNVKAALRLHIFAVLFVSAVQLRTVLKIF